MDQRVGIGVVGLHFGAYVIEQELMRGAGAPGFVLRAVCDLDADKARALGERYGVPAYSSLSDLLNDPAVEVVGLFTGPAGRAALIGQILRSGRDVMTTKPFERDPEAASAVLREAEALGRTVYLNSPGPFLEPALRRFKELEADYDLGRPVALRWETWCSYREQADGSWYDDPARCPVAPLFRLGIYGINDFLHVMAGRARPESAQVVTSRLFTQRPTPDQAMALLRFTDGTLASLMASFCIDDGSAYPDTLTVSYERGTIQRKDIERAADGSEQYAVRLFTGPRSNPLAHPPAIFPKPVGASYPWEALLAARRGEGRPAETSPETLVDGIRVVNALAEAEQSGTAVMITREATG